MQLTNAIGFLDGFCGWRSRVEQYTSLSVAGFGLTRSNAKLSLVLSDLAYRAQVFGYRATILWTQWAELITMLTPSIFENPCSN